MRALVTGGAGFLGSCLADCLLSAGIEVDVLDDLSQGSMGNLHNSLKNSRFRFFLGSINDQEPLADLVDKADLVFHLAALVGMRNLMESKKASLKTNAKGAYNVLNLCARDNKRTVIFSSSEVYGGASRDALREDTPLNPGTKDTPRWYYAVGKICSERAALRRFEDNGLPVTIVRPFNATGIRQSCSGGMVVPNFVRSAIRNEPITVFGTGEQRRTFVASEDLIHQVIGVATDDRSIGKIVNVGGVEDLSILELAELVKNTVKSKSPIKKAPYEEAYGDGYTDLPYRRPDLSLIESLGHCPSFRPISDVISEIASCEVAIA